MSLTGAKISEEVWLTCVTHALSTETEEIMGLLFGDVEHKDGHTTALVWGAAPQTRSDRRKDRVETNPEQLAAASAQAERMSVETGRLTRVIGWYHSHPHITVLPSHVDVRTQGMYQLLDMGFLGLIFSCFNEDGNKVGRIQATAFQSLSSTWQKVNVQTIQQPFTRAPPRDLSSDTERESTPAVSSSSIHSNSADINNGAHEGARGSGEMLVSGIDEKAKVGTENLAMSNEVDSFELTVGMQEAMHLSNLEMSGAEFVRKEVPFQVVPGYTLAKLECPLSSLVSLQRILFDEEQAAYNQSLAQSRRKGKLHPLTSIHHSATYQASLCKLMEYCLTPLLSSLWDRLQANNTRLELLKEESTSLHLQLLARGNRSSRRTTLASTVRSSVHPLLVLEGKSSRASVDGSRDERKG